MVRIFFWGEKLIVECWFLLDNIVLQYSIANNWVWKLDLVHGYSVK